MTGIDGAEEVARLKQEAAKAIEAKSRFLAVISHELRTPMTSVIGMADLLQSTMLRADQRDMVAALRRAATTMVDLLNEILDFSKIEAGHLELDRVGFSLAEVFDGIRSLLAIPASDNGNTLDFRISDGVPARFIGDEKRLRQILINLVGNANKFTHKGHIAVTAAAEIPLAGRHELHIAVTDNGIGIAAENLSKLFKPFSQEDSSTSRRFGGTGLGLSICKTFVELMGGRIWAESERGKGSKFHFTALLEPDVAPADVKAVVPASLGGATAQQQRPLTILVAEDDPVIRTLIEAMLTRSGHACTMVENGAEAVAAVGTKDFQIAVIDMQMPVMDGTAAAQAIRSRPDNRRDLPIIALTADAISDNHARYLGSGINAVLTKPIDWRALGRELQRLTDPHGVPDDAPPVAARVGETEQPILDVDFLEVAFSTVKPELAERLFQRFLAHSDEYAGEIVRALAEPDVMRAKRFAHALNGISAQFGAMRLNGIAAKIERGPIAIETMAKMAAQLSDERTQVATAYERYRSQKGARPHQASAAV